MGSLATSGRALGRLGFFALMALGVSMMLAASGSYLELGKEHPFFLEKLPLARPRLWLGALYVHFPSALFALPACLVLLSRGVRRRVPRLHRWLGRLTGALVLLAVVPSGLYLAFFAQGGFFSTLGFWLTGLITFIAMALSIRSARAGDFRAHRRFSVHVVAQLSVAVFSRFLLISAEHLELYSSEIYVAALWLPVIGCALAAELLTRPISRSPAKGTHHEEVVANPVLDVAR